MSTNSKWKVAATEESPIERVGFTAAGAAATAILGAFLTKEGWAPKTIASLLTAAGGAAAWTGADPRVRNLGAGAMSAAGGQLTLLLIDERDRKAAAQAANKVRNLANTSALPPDTLESALRRVRTRFAHEDVLLGTARP